MASLCSRFVFYSGFRHQCLPNSYCNYIGIRFFIIIHNLTSKNGCLSAYSHEILFAGSICKHLVSRSQSSGRFLNIWSTRRSSSMSAQLLIRLLTMRSSNSPSLNTLARSFLHLLGIQAGNFSFAFLVIMRRCSRSSWVGKSKLPVYSSGIMQAMDQTSLDYYHWQHCKMTYGDLYCLVLMMELCLSLLWVAPPKSINFTR